MSTGRAELTTVSAALFDIVGILAKFRSEDFDKIVSQVLKSSALNNSDSVTADSSISYWRYLDLLAKSYLDPSDQEKATRLEIEAVNNCTTSHGIREILIELMDLDVKLIIATSLSVLAARRFVERFDIQTFFCSIIARDNPSNIKATLLKKAAEQSKLDPAETVYLADTLKAFEISKDSGLKCMFVTNDYQNGHVMLEAGCTNGIASLSELPDAVRLILQRKKYLDQDPKIYETGMKTSSRKE